MPPPDDPSPRGRSTLPAKIGRYRILDRVGRGAMGVVYSAHDDAMGRPVAVKVLMGDLESDPESRARFYREAQAAAGLLHPNIITIFDAGEDQGRSYIAMQLLEGWPLASYLKQPEAASIERKLDLMIQMCEGLAAAHARGIVHRDLKPGNLFVQSDGLLKILDFGVARLADSSMTATGAMLGTPDYMSPEQARGTQVDTRSDIFSAGGVFYFMLAGRKPFPGPELPAVLRQLQFEEPAELREIDSPPELTRLVMQAMAKNPADRPPRVQELLAGIVRFRRYYQAETRKLATDAGARYDALVSAGAERRRLADLLAMSLEGDEPAVIGSLRERFPAVGERGGAALEAVALDRTRMGQIVADLEAEQQRLGADVESLTRHVHAVEEGERALQDGDAREALRLVEPVRIERPTSRRARELSAQCATRAQEQEALDLRLGGLMAAARAALDARDWHRAIEKCEEALAVRPDLPAPSAMLVEARQGIAREQRRKALLLEQSLDRAAIAVEEGRFDAAEAALAEAELLDPRSSAVADLRVELADAVAAAAEAERVRRLSADEIRRARAVFRRGRYDEAVNGLRSFVDAHPQAGDAVTEADRLSTLRTRLVQRGHERRRQVLQLTSTASSFAERGAFDEALRSVREAVLCDPSDADASALLDDLIARDSNARIERERARAREQRLADAEPVLVAARDAAAQGYLDVALNAALAASRIAPERPDIAELVSGLQQAIASDDEEAFDLADETRLPARDDDSPELRREPAPVAPSPPGRSQDGGMLSHVNQWLQRRRLQNR